MKHIGLTGNVAAGKSSVAALFRRWGATVIDADEIVHQLQTPGTPVLAAIAAASGRPCSTPTASLDRARLRALILHDAGARQELEAIVHQRCCSDAWPCSMSPAAAARRSS